MREGGGNGGKKVSFILQIPPGYKGRVRRLR
jgi:hypothetical protein